MKGKWDCKDMRRPLLYIICDTLILLLLVVSYVPQLQLILLRGSTAGIEQSYVMFSYLFTATQFALIMIYYSHGYPVVDCVKSRELTWLDAYGVIVGPLQMMVLWLGSILLFAACLVYSSPNRTISATDGSSESWQGLSKVMLSIYLVHTCVWILPALIISLQRPIEVPILHPARIFVGFCDFYLIPACIVLVISIFPFQIKELLSARHRIPESCLSSTTLATQMVTFFILAWSWKVKLGRPGDPFNIVPPDATLPSVIYRRGAWQWVNNFIFGLGQGVLLLIYVWSKRRYADNNFGSSMDEAAALI